MFLEKLNTPLNEPLQRSSNPWPCAVLWICSTINSNQIFETFKPRTEHCTTEPSKPPLICIKNKYLWNYFNQLNPLYRSSKSSTQDYKFNFSHMQGWNRNKTLKFYATFPYWWINTNHFLCSSHFIIKIYRLWNHSLSYTNLVCVRTLNSYKRNTSFTKKCTLANHKAIQAIPHTNTCTL